MRNLTTLSPLPSGLEECLTGKWKEWLGIKKPCKAALQMKKEPAKSSMKKRKKQPTKNQQGANKKHLEEEFKNQQKMPTAMGIGVG